MARDHFSLSIEIAASPEAVHDFLADLHRVSALHPLIVRIDELPADPARPRARRFRVVDRLKLGPLPLRIRYRAEIDATSPLEIRATARQFPAIELRTHYRLTPIAGGATRLSEQVDVTAPRMLIGTVRRQAHAAHRETLEKLALRLASDRAATSPGGADGDDVIGI